MRPSRFNTKCEVCIQPHQAENGADPLVMSVDKLGFNNTANDIGEWYINENLDLAYLFALLLILYHQIITLT